jgi:cobalamin biosynthesis Mg chelatase CobN
MNTGEDLDPIEAARADIEATRAELVDTATELSDRLSPAKRVATATQVASDTTKHVVEQAGDVTKDAAAKAQGAVKVSVSRSRQLSAGMERQILGTLVIVSGLLVVWRLWRRRQ